MINNSERVACRVFTRSMGFYRPVSFFNIGKQSEFKQRKFFEESAALSHT